MNAAIRLLGWTLAIVLVSLPIVALLQGWFATDRWPVQRMQVTAEFQRVSSEQIRGAVQPYIGGGFFAVRVEHVRAAVSELPWVDAVEVRKRWPDLLEITVREHRAFARWGADRLLGESGAVFSAPGAADLQGLPELDGPLARAGEVVDMYEQAGKVFAGTGLSVRGMQLSARGSWTLQLGDGGEVMLGREQPLPRLRRFARVLPQLLAGERRPLLRADLRYTNGFALRWAEPENGARSPDSGASSGATARPSVPSIRHSPFPISGRTA